MQRLMNLLPVIFLGVQVAQAQIQAEASIAGGYPFMLSGRNTNFSGTVTGRLQISYQEETPAWQPYLALGISPMELPLHNKQINTLSLQVLNFSVNIGLIRVLKNNGRYIWSAGGGLGVCMLSPDGATLYMDGNGTNLGYSALTNDAWFPQVELIGKWLCYPKPELNWYLGMQWTTSGVWLRDTKARYTANIYGTNYHFSLNDVAIWPSFSGIVGYRF